ncbi:hypothetical protein [Paenibacillus sonchi]|uniref:hypothetical protein n=1 Tax=Paenibacillus sonchi TaxID=373687 RepID=UPI001E5476FC|nr:hypothetical protein [Paenibacillus sonchi]MCE3203359.1 hypothetical protein [Paenibacillus sonchi]
MGVIDVLLLIAYSMSLICALLLIAALFLYFRRRLRAKAVSLFMVAAFFFLSAYTFQMAIALWIRFTAVPGAGAVLASLQTEALAVAQTGTTIGLLILTLLVFTKRQDLFIVLQEGKKGGASHADPDTNQK